ncbi:MAG: SBBP repeat-containing protein [Ignavibacteria bacterium]|nr:SBBP repeat-containing protein [Ignavibacteria bacterium]
MKTKLIIFAFFAAATMMLSVQTSRSQVTQVWEQRYNGTADSTDIPKNVVVDAAGNVYVTGSTRSSSGAHLDIVTIKYNSEGSVQWLQKYNGPADSSDYPESIVVDASGNVYVTGSSFVIGSKYDIITIKYNSQGVQQWLQTYNGTAGDLDFSYDLSVDPSGNVFIAGSSIGNGTSYDYVLIKYTSAGVQQWVQRYNGTGNSFDSPFQLEIDNTGNIFLSGYSTGIGTGYDYLTIKYNSSGVLQWEQRYNGIGNSTDVIKTMAVDGAGNVYISGFSDGGSSGSDWATIKYNSAGVQQWIQRYNGAGNGQDAASSLAVDDSGNVYISGYTSGSTSSDDYLTIKYNSTGVQQWQQTYNGPGNAGDDVYSLTIDGTGNIYVTGYSFGSGTYNDYATVKYNSAGTQQWIQRFNGTAGNSDEAYSVTVDGSGNVYVTGSSRSSTGFDIATIKYSQTVGIQNIGNEIPEGFSLSQNYPNPFNPKTNIGLRIAGFGFVSLKVFDITGKEVSVLVNEELSAGVYNVDFEASNLSSGTYFYSMETAGFRDVKKMVIVK